MAYNLIVTEHADTLIDSLAGYLAQDLHNSDAALHFLDEMESIYARLEENPLQFPKSADDFLKRRGYREALLSRMDYRVVFRIEEPQTVYIVGVFHTLENYRIKVEEPNFMN